MRFLHKAAHFHSAGTERRNITRIVEQRCLGDSDPYRTDHGFVRSLADMLKSCGVRFAGFGCASTYKAFEISVLRHCQAFHASDAVPQQPARNDRTKTTD
ncbi:hypothetical protein AS890_26460 [Rhizobium anhuiense bv. trifolii]|nr:hypothetical protein AS890_26460 [Rhizobium anhuiense bv. trifolii]